MRTFDGADPALERSSAKRDTRTSPYRGEKHALVTLLAGSRSPLSYRGEDVVATLERVCREHGYPQSIRVDQGSEFISRDRDLWAYQKDVVLDFSRPGKPTDNSFIESFNGKFRAESEYPLVPDA